MPSSKPVASDFFNGLLGKKSTITVTAVARELAGLMWAIACEVPAI